MNIERLVMLRVHVAGRDPERFDQDVILIKNRKIDPCTECGCVLWDLWVLFGGQGREALGITESQAEYIFGIRENIRITAATYRLPIPESFGPLDAAARIQQVIDGAIQ